MLKKIFTIAIAIFFLSALPYKAFAYESVNAREVLVQADTEYDWDSYDWETAFDDLESEYNVDTTLTEEESAAAVLFATIFGGVFLVIWAIFILVGYIYGGLTMMTIAKKLKEKNPWMAWVPLANMYLYAKLGGFNGWMALLFFVPFVNFVFMIIVTMKISERRGFPNWLGLLMLVPIANVILPGYLAWAEPAKKTEESK